MTLMRASVDRRIRVLVVRRRLEEQAATLVGLATGTRPTKHAHVGRRLMLLAAGASADEWTERHGLARRSAAVYAETSVVLHSNRAFGDVHEVLVLEWERTVAEVDALLAARVSVHGTA